MIWPKMRIRARDTVHVRHHTHRHGAYPGFKTNNILRIIIPWTLFSNLNVCATVYTDKKLKHEYFE